MICWLAMYKACILLFHLVTVVSLQCLDMIANQENIQVMNSWNCSSALHSLDMFHVKRNEIISIPCSLAIPGKNDDFVKCACPPGQTDAYFQTQEEREKGVGTIKTEDFARVSCSQQCSEKYGLIIAKQGYSMDACACHTVAGCLFQDREFPHEASHSVVLIPDDLSRKTGIVKCFNTDAYQTNTNDIVICSEFGLDFNFAPGNEITESCIYGEWFDAKAKKCTECTKCAAPHYGIREECSTFTDTKCEKCEANAFVSAIDGRCYYCDSNEIWNAKSQKCEFQQRNIFQNKCSHKPGHIFLPWTQSCEPCGVNKFQVENQCLDCPASSYSAHPAATTCTLCPPASVRPHSQRRCQECNPGFHALKGKCHPCPKNHVRILGMESCVSCLPGYESFDGISCVQCLDFDADTCEKCPGTNQYLDRSDMKCKKCRSNATCSSTEKWNCNQCEPKFTKYMQSTTYYQHTLPIAAGKEFVLSQLEISFSTEKDGRNFEETSAILYANSGFFLDNTELQKYKIKCLQPFYFIKDVQSGLYFCSQKTKLNFTW